MSDISHSFPVLESWMSAWVKVKNLYRTSWVREMPSAMWWWAKLIRIIESWIHWTVSVQRFLRQSMHSVNKVVNCSHARVSKLFIIWYENQFNSFSCLKWKLNGVAVTRGNRNDAEIFWGHYTALQIQKCILGEWLSSFSLNNTLSKIKASMVP